VLQSIAERLGGIPIAGVVALLALALVQVPLQIFALVDLLRRPAGFGGRKWLWALIIVLAGLIGAIAYLVRGRRVEAMPDDAGDAGAAARARALERLYGRGSDR